MTEEDHLALEAYDPKAAARALASGRINGPGRKLTFFDQCAAFYALYNGAEARVVAKTFAISRIAVSQLGGCLKRDPRPISVELKIDDKTGVMYEHETVRDMNRNRSPVRIARYRRVAEEFERLGEEAFAAKYYPEHISKRLMEVKYDLDATAARVVRRGADPTDDGLPNWVDLPDGQARTMIGWRDEPNPPGPPGWYIIGEHMDFGSQHDTGEQWPFKTQQKAREGVWLMNSYKLEDMR